MIIALIAAASACWPTPGCTLSVPESTIADDFVPRQVFLIAGHGNGAPGNTGVFGQIEAEDNLTISQSVGHSLVASGHFSVHQGRLPGEEPSFQTRLERRVASGAPVLVEIHTDARMQGSYTWQSPTGPVLRNDDAPGFSVLYNETGPLGPQRRALAVSVASAMQAAGFHPFMGGYAEQYDADAQAGVYIDRRGLFILRRPLVPSIIIETHHALDPIEAKRWTEAATHQAFAVALGNGLAGWFAGVRSPPE